MSSGPSSEKQSFEGRSPMIPIGPALLTITYPFLSLMIDIFYP